MKTSKSKDAKLTGTRLPQTVICGILNPYPVWILCRFINPSLILAGSILEAVLIDWLSEIKGVDFFKKTYMVKDDKGKDKPADLNDYINEIKYIERPHWMEEANKAHAIRKKRNLVHAKLCMKSNEINEEVCREVIGYLKDVLKTRGAV